MSTQRAFNEHQVNRKQAGAPGSTGGQFAAKNHPPDDRVQLNMDSLREYVRSQSNRTVAPTPPGIPAHYPPPPPPPVVPPAPSGLGGTHLGLEHVVPSMGTPGTHGTSVPPPPPPLPAANTHTKASPFRRLFGH